MSQESLLSPDAWVARLFALPLARIEVRVRSSRPIRLDAPVCSVVRGLIGERLRDLRCLTRVADCVGCSEQRRCDYARLFKGQAALLASAERGAQPFWLQGLPASSELPAGAELTVRLVAAGPALDALPYLDVALRDALSRLGATRHERLGPIRAASLTLSASAVEQSVPWPALRSDHGADALQLEALTPILLRGDATESRRLAPRAPLLATCARAAVRRLDSVLSTFSSSGSGRSPRFAFPDLSRVEFDGGSGLRPWRGSRFSRRQGRRMPLDGVTGSLLVRGPGVADLAPLFAVLELVNLGKATTMGFGHVRVVSGRLSPQPQSADLRPEIPHA